MPLSKSDSDKLQGLLDDMNAKAHTTKRTTGVVSAFAYPIGVPRNIFDNPHEAPEPEIYEKLDREKAARIVRNLCLIRTAIERNFGKIFADMRDPLKSIASSPYVPQPSVLQLTQDGAEPFKWTPLSSFPLTPISGASLPTCRTRNSCS